MTEWYGYRRVSDQKQEDGASLSVQTQMMERYAREEGLSVVEWFEDIETAAKRGRREFNRLVRALRRGKAAGVIFHKVDRSARNLHDWAAIGELVDRGIGVRFAHDRIDLQSRSGRLLADLMAVLATDYVRNLKEEVRKGISGRLEQGLYPWAAPPGYQNRGKGRPKTIDPLQGPLVREAFERYSTGRHNLEELAALMYQRGLRFTKGARRGKIDGEALGKLFRNPFYIGLIHVKRTGETYRGVHEPLVGKRLFDRVRELLDGKSHTKAVRHQFTFRRLVRCRDCGKTVTGERQRGHVYYRCHTRGCPTAVREERISEKVEALLRAMQFGDDEEQELRERLPSVVARELGRGAGSREALRCTLGQTKDRLLRLTDAYVDREIDRDVYLARKDALLAEEKELEEQIVACDALDEGVATRRLEQIFEHARTALLSYHAAPPEERRELVEMMTSNISISGKDVSVEPSEPMRIIAERRDFFSGAPERGKPRRGAEVSRPPLDAFRFAYLDALIESLLAWIHDDLKADVYAQQ